ncbi:hypothetical protein KKC59_02560 [bacterium]|nr:hypothetical protein [bacterium]
MSNCFKVCLLFIYIFSCIFFINPNYIFCEPKPIDMNFKNVNIDNVLDFIGEATGMVVVKDPSFTDEISIVTPASCDAEQALEILNSVISAKGYTLVQTGNVLKIIPLKNAKREDIKFSTAEDSFKIKENQDVITQLIPLSHSNAKEIVNILNPLVSAFGEVAAYEKTNKILITDSSANIKRLMEIVKELDIAREPKTQSKVYDLLYANAKEIGAVIKSLGGKAVVDADLRGVYSGVEGEVKVVVYDKTNTLIITTNSKNFEFIGKIIDQLDKSAPQVLIEAIILEVTWSNDDRLGVGDISVPGDNAKGFLSSSLGERLNWKYSLNLQSGNGFSWLGSENPDEYSGLMDALFEQENVNVISTPVILTSDKKEATITVGEEVPIIKGKTVSTKTVNDRPDYDFVYEYQDVGVKLTVVPYINQDDSVYLELHQEVKERTGETLFDSPVLQIRRADTSVHVKDGQTIVIGGLVKDKITKRTAKVPLLGDIPVLGYLFKNERDIKEKVELMVFITPRIIMNNTDMSNASKQKVRKTSKLGDVVKENNISLEPPVSVDDTKSRAIMIPEGYMEIENDVTPLEKADKKDNSTKKSIFNIFKRKQKESDDKTLPLEETFSYKDNLAEENFVDKYIEPNLREDVGQSETDLGNVSSEEGYVLKETLYRRGVEFYKKGQYKEAIREFVPIMSIDPKYKNVERYLQLCQQKFQEQVSDEMGERPVLEEQQREVVRELSSVDMPMDVKKEEIIKEEPDYSKDTMFGDQRDYKNVPEDRIDKMKMDKLSGRVIEVSDTHEFVVINLGQVNKLTLGMVFRVYRGEDLVGKITVSEVQDHVAGADIISKKSPDFKFALGDIVVLEG